MVCPKCKTEAVIRRVKGVTTYICRKPSFPFYQKPIKANKGSK